MDTIGVECGHCGGPVYMEPCPAHEYATASECQRCGQRYEINCPDCKGEVSPDAD